MKGRVDKVFSPTFAEDIATSSIFLRHRFVTEGVTNMNLKIRVRFCLWQTGTTQTFLATNTGIPRETLNRFLTGKRQLPRYWIRTLDQFLTARGY